MLENTLQIRVALRTDIDSIVRLINAGGPDGKPRRALPDTLPESYQKAFTAIDSSRNQHLMVAELDGVIVGTFQLAYLTYLAGENRPDAQIEAIHVKTELRGRGIGTRMLKWVIAEAKANNCRRVQLTTDKQRTAAHGFYRRLGFGFSHEGAKLYL